MEILFYKIKDTKEEFLKMATKVVVLIGKAAVGKDALLHAVMASGVRAHPLVSCTSRSMREGERDGVNYYFYTPEEFENKIKNGQMLEYVQFNNWWYGLSEDSFDENAVNFCVLNPQGVKTLIDKGYEVYPILLYAHEKTRLMRQLLREEHPNTAEIVRRYDADRQDFAELDFQLYDSFLNESVEDFGTAAINIAKIINELVKSN